MPHISDMPEITGELRILIVTVLVQSTLLVNVMSDAPTAIPVTIPDALTVATAGFELVQEPSVILDERLVVAPTQRFVEPEITAIGFTVIAFVAVQPFKL
jgi:hypothetical protein